MKRLKEPEWVCLECATARFARIPEGHIPTWSIGICGLCGEEKEVTEPRDFGITRKFLLKELPNDTTTGQLATVGIGGKHNEAS